MSAVTNTTAHEKPRKPFAMIDHRVFDNWMPVIGANATLVYFTLCRFADYQGGCWPSIATIESKTTLSRSTVQRALKTLVDYNMVRITEHCHDTANGPRSNHYLLLEIPDSPVQKTDVEGFTLTHSSTKNVHGVKQVTQTPAIGHTDLCSRSHRPTNYIQIEQDTIELEEEAELEGVLARRSQAPVPAKHEEASPPLVLQMETQETTPPQKAFPGTEPSPNNKIGHLLWRISVDDGSPLTNAQVGRYLKIAQDLLTVFTEDQIVDAYRWRKSRQPGKPYQFAWLQNDIAGILAAMRNSPGPDKCAEAQDARFLENLALAEQYFPNAS